MNEIKISTEMIKLDQFLKFIGVVSTGGEAKEVILNGQVKVNDVKEEKRGRKLYKGDVVEILKIKYIVS